MNNKILPTLLLLFICMLSQSVYAQKPLPKPGRPHKTVIKPRSHRQSCTVEYSVSGSFCGHDYVDLGLSSGLKWATCNVGASSPEEYGGYYAWGETFEKSEYTKENSVTFNRKFGDISGKSQYDSARNAWGENWRMPTKSEIKELVENCEYEWITNNGVEGCLFKSKKNGNKIFFPAAGRLSGDLPNLSSELGFYWSSSNYENNNKGAYALYINYKANGYAWYHRCDGRTIRAVAD